MYTCEGSLKKSLFSLSEIDLLKSEMYIVTPLTAAVTSALATMLADSCGNQIRRHVVETGLRGLRNRYCTVRILHCHCLHTVFEDETTCRKFSYLAGSKRRS